MAFHGTSGVDNLATPKKRNGKFFSASPMDTWQVSSPTRSYIFRDKAYASPSVALEAYITSELGQGTIRRKREDVENLMVSDASDDFARNSPRHRTQSRNILDEIQTKKNLSIHQMVDEAYSKLQAAKNQSAHDVLQASEATLNKISADNLSSLPSVADSQVSTASTNSLLPNAPDVAARVDKKSLLVSDGDSTKGHRRYKLNSSLEKLKRSVNERDKENLLASHLTSKALGTLAKLKKEKCGVKTHDARADSDDLSDKLQRLRDDLRDDVGKVYDPHVIRISGKVKVPLTTEYNPQYEHLKRKHRKETGSQDDLYLLMKSGNTRRKKVDQFDSIRAELLSVKGFNTTPVRHPKGPPSWVEDLANTEISSVVSLDFGVGHEDRLEASNGQALSLDDLSLSYRRNKAPSRVLRGKTIGTRNSAVDKVFSNELSTQGTVNCKDDTDFDVVSLTTDDLCFAAPDASNLKSILRTPSSTPRRPQTRLSSSTDDLIVESLQPVSHSSPSKSASPSRQGVRFHINGDVYDGRDSPRNSNEEFVSRNQAHRDYIPRNSNEEFVSRNQAHRDYIRQLMRDIEDSESVITSSLVQDKKTRDAHGMDNPEFLSEEILEEGCGPYETLSMTEVKRLNDFAKGYESGNDQFGYLEKIQRLLATPPLDETAEESINASRNTEDVLNGDRSWEKNVMPKFQSVPYQEMPSAGASGEKNIVDQFLEDCKGNANAALSRDIPPGSMEALKNMLFTVQTLVPPGELSGLQENSFLSMAENEKPSGRNENTVPANLQHLLASESDLENSKDNTNSLSVAMQHLDTLKTLMDSRRVPQMTSTPNK